MYTKHGINKVKFISLINVQCTPKMVPFLSDCYQTTVSMHMYMCKPMFVEDVQVYTVHVIHARMHISTNLHHSVNKSFELA